MPLFLHISNAQCRELTASLSESRRIEQGRVGSPMNAECHWVSKLSVVDVDHLLNFL